MELKWGLNEISLLNFFYRKSVFHKFNFVFIFKICHKINSRCLCEVELNRIHSYFVWLHKYCLMYSKNLATVISFSSVFPI